MSGHAEQQMQQQFAPGVALHQWGIQQLELPDGGKIKVLRLTTTLDIPIDDALAKQMIADLSAAGIVVAQPGDVPPMQGPVI